MTFRIDPVTLTGTHVRLEPLDRAHARDLFEAGRDPAVWRYLVRTAFDSVGDAEAWIDETLERQAAGDELPFAIVHLGLGTAVGSTRYMDIRPAHRAVEIGWTWLGTPHHRTAINTECKLLLLTHAFDSFGVNRVQFKTDGRNLKSQRAIERIGGVREGVLRNSVVLHDGYVRDSAYYSILASEWPAVRTRLRTRLADGVGGGSPGASIACVHHVQITVPAGGEAAARRFYCETLGLVEIPKPDALLPGGGFWVRAGLDEVHVGIEDGVDRDRTRAHVAYETSDLAGWGRRLAAAGVEASPCTPLEGMTRLKCRDPFGNMIELIERTGG